jgi:hypothetical protein
MSDWLNNDGHSVNGMSASVGLWLIRSLVLLPTTAFILLGVVEWFSLGSAWRMLAISIIAAVFITWGLVMIAMVNARALPRRANALMGHLIFALMIITYFSAVVMLKTYWFDYVVAINTVAIEGAIDAVGGNWDAVVFTISSLLLMGVSMLDVVMVKWRLSVQS